MTPLLLAALVAVATGCGGPREEPKVRAAVGFPDTRSVPEGNEADATDLPGIARLEELDPRLQARVVERANRAACDCGCVGHAVSDCLRQREPCDVALRLATGFVDDALAFQAQSGGEYARPEPAAAGAEGQAKDLPEGDEAGAPPERGDAEDAAHDPAAGDEGDAEP